MTEVRYRWARAFLFRFGLRSWRKPPPRWLRGYRKRRREINLEQFILGRRTYRA